MHQLIIRLIESTQEELNAEWRLFDDAGKQITAGMPVPLSQLAETLPPQASESAVIFIVPGTQATCVAVDVPAKQRRHLKQVLPYLLEEKLAEDVNLLHLAVGKAEGQHNLPVVAIRKSLMQEWLRYAKATGLSLQAVIAEPQLLPYAEGTWCLLYDGNMVWLRCGKDSLYAIEAEMFSVLLELLNTAGEPAQRVECHITHGAQSADMENRVAEWQQYLPSLVWQGHVTPSVMDFLCAHYLKSGLSPVNLMQGEFAAPRRAGEMREGWRMLGRIAAAWFIAQVTLDGGQAIYFSHQAQAMAAQSAALYKQTFPADTKIINPVEQMRGHLASGGTSDAGGFLHLTRKLVSVWNGHNNAALQMENMTYNGDTYSLTLNIQAERIDALNMLAQQLNGRGMEAKIVSLVNDKDGARAQLSVAEGKR